MPLKRSKSAKKTTKSLYTKFCVNIKDIDTLEKVNKQMKKIKAKYDGYDMGEGTACVFYDVLYTPKNKKILNDIKKSGIKTNL